MYVHKSDEKLIKNINLNIAQKYVIDFICFILKKLVINEWAKIKLYCNL